MTAKNSAAKGRKLVNYAKAILEARGARVETAGNQIAWFQNSAGRWVPRSLKHDYFGVWDLLALWPEPYKRAFYQVTTATHVSHRREKILAAGSWNPYDAIVAWYGGRGRHFKVYYGPDFAEATERWDMIPQAKPLPSSRSSARAHHGGEAKNPECPSPGVRIVSPSGSVKAALSGHSPSSHSPSMIV